MEFQHSSRAHHYIQLLEAFMEEHVYPNERRFHSEVAQAQNRWCQPPVMKELISKARAAGLWNLFLSNHPAGPGLSHVEYAPLAEIMGRVIWASEIFNCSAPDTGNMEVLLHYGSEEQKRTWLEPLLEGGIRSCFAMTEPAVASSDATNIAASIRRDGKHYVINGQKWFITNAAYDRCTIMILFGQTDPAHADRHYRHSQVLIPMDTPGVTVTRNLTTFGYDDAPAGHAQVDLRDVRVPISNVILGEGRGFEIAQGRLGPGRIHHCMRLIGCAQRALELACQRVGNRVAFGQKLAEQGSIRESVAHAAAQIEQARLLTLRAADKMDREGNKAARDLIAMAKLIVPSLAAAVIDSAMQMHGAAGFTADFPLAEAYAYARWVRVADGPDQVHAMTLGKSIIRRYMAV